MDLDSVDHPGRFFSFLARDLKSLALSNIQFFQNGKQSHHAKFHMSFSLLYEYLDVGIEPSYRELSKYLHHYDLSPEVKGNGYRSLLQVVHKCCLHLLQLSRYISNVKDSMLFRKKYYANELEAYVSALGQLRAILYYALKLVHYCQEGELFADEEKLDTSIADHLMMEVESLNLECFYGRCLGFQFCESMMRPVQIMNIAMASYSDGYLESSGVMQVATSVFNSGKYFMDPELRATQLAKVTRTADIKFCKAFWSISELGLVQQLPSMVCPSVEVNEFFSLGPDAFELPLVDGSDTVVITPPCAHVGPGHVMVRLLSSSLREGQQVLRKATKSKSPVTAKPRTPGLVIHIHGGGFIAQSSKSHEMYLRDWARILDIPILSVDYSLAPELPFPRALEDCFYAYSWALKNCHQLGSLGEKIILCGDSAGGNLAISTAMRAASFGIRRPEGVLGVYPVTMARYLPSPARLLSLMDPILPVGIVSRCLAAYAGIDEEHPLASPSSQEFHSKSSLNSIRMQTVESSDNEWVIIGQDQDECMQVDKRLEHSSATSTIESGSKSVIDGMEDSFNEDLIDSPRPGHRKLCRSDTVESDEVEIFSRLRENGSCQFSNDDKTINEEVAGGRRAEKGTLKSSCNNKDGIVNSQDNEEKFLSISSMQETAKSMMEGAQSMLTSLTSYIPSRSTTTDHSTAHTNTKNQDRTKCVDFYTNRSISSDGVDLSSKSEECMSPVNSFPNISRSDDLLTSASERGVENYDGDDELSASILKNVSTTPTTRAQQNVCDHGDHNFDSISLASDDCNVSTQDEPQTSKPMIGTSPIVEELRTAVKLSPTAQELVNTPPGLSHSISLSDISHHHHCQISDSPKNKVFPAVPSLSSTHSLQPMTPDLAPVQNVDLDSLQPMTPDLAPVQNVDLATAAINDQNQYPDNSHVTLSHSYNTSLTPENQQLLKDTLDSIPNSGAEDQTNSNSVSKTSIPDIKNVIQHNTVEPTSPTTGATATTTNNLTHNSTSSPRSPPYKPPSDLNLSATTKNPIPTTTLSPTPPKRHTNDGNNTATSLSPSPNQIFTEDSSDLDSVDTDLEGAIFKTSCLEFLAPSSSPNEAPCVGNRPAVSDLEIDLNERLSSGMFRSDSAPAFSALLSPSPTESKGSNQQQLPFPNGLKMGMSPSDFKRQSFTPHSPINTMRKALVVRNPYMSPLMADAELLKGLPPVCLVASNLDPLLDDSVMFAKKLRRLDMPVQLHLLDDLPHGFLNFSMISPEAKKASQFCANQLLEMINKEQS